MSELQSPELFDGPGGGSWSGGFGTDDAGRIIWLHGEFDDHAWRRAAACRDLDPGLFFPVGFTGAAAQQIAEAKAVCRGCPVRLACLQFALVSTQECGVWGGYDEEERRVLRRQWRELGRPLQMPRAPSSDPTGAVGPSSVTGAAVGAGADRMPAPGRTTGGPWGGPGNSSQN
jgi:WhiB family redox-sensing transcriptional regulator